MCSMSRPARGRVARSYVGLPWVFLCMGSRSWSRRGRWVRPWPKARPYGPAEGACYDTWKNTVVRGYSYYFIPNFAFYFRILYDSGKAVPAHVWPSWDGFPSQLILTPSWDGKPSRDGRSPSTENRPGMV